MSYERLCHERDRLRDARGYFSRPLGPAPASAGISTALVATLGSNLNGVFVGLALASLLLLVAVGICYDGKPPYRQLYASVADSQRDRANPVDLDGSAALDPRDVMAPVRWYATMIARELAVIGPTVGGSQWRWPWAPVTTLQEGVDSERTGMRVVQALWSLVILFLVLAVIV